MADYGGQERNVNIFFVGVRGFVCDLFLRNSSCLNGPGSSKLPRNKTLHCRFYPATWQIFKVGGGVNHPHATLKFRS